MITFKSLFKLFNLQGPCRANWIRLQFDHFQVIIINTENTVIG